MTPPPINPRNPAALLADPDWPVADQPDVSATPREAILRGAAEAVLRQRNNTYGPPTQDFARSAGICNALGFRFVDAEGRVSELQPHHIAMIQQAVKMSRLTWDPGHVDSWIDMAGYAACGYECAAPTVEP